MNQVKVLSNFAMYNNPMKFKNVKQHIEICIKMVKSIK